MTRLTGRAATCRALGQVATLVSALVLAPFASAVAQPAAAAPRSTHPACARWTSAPFDTALANFSDTYARVIGIVLAAANVPGIQDAMKTGTFNSEELLLYYLQRLHHHDDRLRSLLELNPARAGGGPRLRRASRRRQTDQAARRHSRHAEGQHRDRRPDAHHGRRRTARPRMAAQDAPLVAQLRRPVPSSWARPTCRSSRA